MEYNLDSEDRSEVEIAEGSNLIKNFLEENEYKNYLQYENNHSTIFLKTININGSRFYSSEYVVFEPVFNNNLVMQKIYDVIHDLIKEQNLSIEAKFMILGDFLFSMTSCDLRDPGNIVFKTSRDDYLDKIVLRSSINEYFGYEWYNSFIYLETHKKLLIGMRINGVLKKNIVKKNKNGSWESTVYYKLEVPEIEEKYGSFLGVCDKPFVIRKILNSSYSVGSFRSIWKIKRKKREMEGQKISYSGVEKANKICFVISKENYLINERIIRNEMTRLLNNCNCLSFEEYIKKATEAIKENSLLTKLFFRGGYAKEAGADGLWKMKDKKNKEVIFLLKNFQKIIGMELVKKDVFNKDMYLPCFIDNRGRQYYGTLLSPTFNKVFRYMYSFKKKKKN
jgi:hypothetical protein